MNSERKADIFLFDDSFLFTTRVIIKRVEENKIVLSSTPLLRKFAVLGRRLYIKYATFALPVKVVGKNDEELIVSLPTLNPEKPVGDRRSARVVPSHVHPVKIYLSPDGQEEKEYEAMDISEGGFSVRSTNPAELEAFLDKEVKVHIDFPVEGEEVFGKAHLVNVQELEDGSVKLGFELIAEDADTVKVRFYVYSRIKEMLRQGR